MTLTATGAAPAHRGGAQVQGERKDTVPHNVVKRQVARLVTAPTARSVLPSSMSLHGLQLSRSLVREKDQTDQEVAILAAGG